MLLRQKNRQIQGFLRKYSSNSKIHQFCCQNQQQETSIRSSNIKIKQNPQRITLKKQRTEANQRILQQNASKSPHNYACSSVFLTQQPDNFLSLQRIKRPQTDSFTKICFRYPLTRVKSQEILPTMETLPILGSQHLSRKIESQQMSNQSLEYQLKVPVSEAKSNQKIDFTISMQNPSHGLASPQFSRPNSPSVDLQLEENGFAFSQMKNQMRWIKEIKSQREYHLYPEICEYSARIFDDKITQIHQQRVQKKNNQQKFIEKFVENTKITIEDSQLSSVNQSEKEKRLTTYRTNAEN